jgi:hypothetical protein
VVVEQLMLQELLQSVQHLLVELAGSATVCTGTNSTTQRFLETQEQLFCWESSTDAFCNSRTTIANTTTSLTATNLTATTTYRAVVKEVVLVLLLILALQQLQ